MCIYICILLSKNKRYIYLYVYIYIHIFSFNITCNHNDHWNHVYAHCEIIMHATLFADRMFNVKIQKLFKFVVCFSV